MRRAFTMIEAIVAVAVAALVIGLAIMMCGASARAQRAPEPLAQRAALRALLACIAEDLLQLGTAHDQVDPIRVSADAFAFQRTEFAGAAIALRPATYRFAGGRLVRTERAGHHELPAVPLSACRFARVDDPRTAQCYLLVQLVGARGAEVSALLPLPAPAARGNPVLARGASVQVFGELPAL